MKINVITIKTQDDFNAGQKAPADIVNILKSAYNARSTIFDNSGSKFKKTLKRFFKTFRFTYEFLKSRILGEIVVLQFPLFETTKFLNWCLLKNMKLLNYNKTIILIHDLEGVRNNSEILKKQEMDRFKCAKYVIAHNDRMKQQLINDGITSNVYTLKLFDYLCDIDDKKVHDINKNFSVVYAGNLSKVKCPFIYSVDLSKMKYTINLYGVGINNDINKKIKYFNKYAPKDLPNKIVGDLGLIWDGEADERDENIGMKCYTKINNPHKLSCYIAAGIPVIAWRKAAISDFIKKNNIGYLICNIEDINNIDLSDYKIKLNNVLNLRKKVSKGYYTKKVFDEIFDDMKCE